MKTYALSKNDGSILIMSTLDNIDIEEEVKKLPDAGQIKSYREITDDQLPADRDYRAAWVDDGHNLQIDMPKAQTVHMEKIRSARDEKLKALDVETLKGKDVQEQKQKLRDIPQTFDLTTAKTPDELKQLWPEELK